MIRALPSSTAEAAHEKRKTPTTFLVNCTSFGRKIWVFARVRHTVTSGPAKLRRFSSPAFTDKYLEWDCISPILRAGPQVKSGRGKYGGYRLVNCPAEYNVYEILYAAERTPLLSYLASKTM